MANKPSSHVATSTVWLFIGSFPCVESSSAIHAIRSRTFAIATRDFAETGRVVQLDMRVRFPFRAQANALILRFKKRLVPIDAHVVSCDLDE